MTGDTPLAQKLAALVARDEFEEAALILGPSGQPDTLDRLLAAVDQTMLLRDAVFAVGQSAVTLRVSGKRVQAVTEATADLDPPDGLTGTALGPDMTQELSAVTALLSRLVALPGTLTLDRRLAEQSSGQSGTGVGIQALLAQVDRGATEPDAPHAKPAPMAAFVSALIPDALALIALEDGDIAGVAGDDAAVEDLQQTLTADWDSFDAAHLPFLKSDAEACLRVLDRTGPEGQCFVIAKIDVEQCLALIKTEDAPRIAAAWAAALS